MATADFDAQFRQGYRLTLIDIYYYMPDHRSLIQEFIWQTQEFIWQTLDLPPRFPRIHEFLQHWRRNIQAVIKEVLLSTTDGIHKPTFHKVDHILRV